MPTQDYIAGQLMAMEDKHSKAKAQYYYHGSKLVCNELGWVRPVNLPSEQEMARGYISAYFTQHSYKA